ncbi:MAG: DUF342 domain-containing protein [Sulfurimonas sp.]|nr:DUF342 domain-containing protein [Sulfurimonas sp.]
MIYLLSKKVKTKNISAAISKLAAENEISESGLHFDLNGVETYIKTAAKDEFNLYIDDPLNYYNDFDKTIDEQVEFKQLYSITIKDDSRSIIKLKYDINYSDNNIHPYIILHPDSRIPYKKYKPKDIYLLLLKELNNIKAKNKFLIKVFDNKMKEKLKVFIKHLYKGNFTKKVKLPLFTGIDPEVRRNSELIMKFLRKATNHQIIEVDSGEVLIEFIKPIFGKNGLNAFGEIVDNTNKNNKDDLQCYIDNDSIETIENDDKKIYKSKQKGYVHFDEKDFYVDNKIEMQRLSRVQDSLTKEEDNKIEVIISQNDTSLDSLGEGVDLTSETIHITGHIGAKSTLKAVNLKIDGATHQDSLQEAKFAEINRHKGKLRCASAKIKLLEGGEVHATDVEIESSLGGSVYAENVTIGLVKHHLKVYASNSITIKRVMGEDNLFKINYKDIPTLNSRYNFVTKEINDLKYRVEGALKHSPDQVPVLKEQINNLKSQQNKIINAVKSAKITINEPLRGLNTIAFTIDDEHELIFKTDATSYEPFYLIESGDTITLHPTDKKIFLES